MILTNTGVLKLMQRIKSFITAQLNTKANSVHTHTISEIDDLSSLQMGGGGYTKSEVDTLLNGKSDTGHTHTVSDVTDFPTLSTVATSGSYNDLSNKPTIPIVDSALSSTSTNALQNKVINTELSKKANASHTHTVSDVTDFPTLATVATSGSYNDLSNKPTTMTPTSHTHGNITNDGKIGSNANKPLITTTGGTVTTSSFGTSANTFCEGNDSRLSDARTPTSHTHVKSEITDFPSLATVATSGSYSDLSNKPTIPTVNNATLTIQKNGTDIKTFTANASSDVTCNITVPTKVSELTNDSGFLTSHQSLSNYSTLSNTVKSLSISGKTITVTPGSGNAYTLTTQDTTYTHPTSSGNKHIPSGGSSGQFLGWSADGTAKWVNNPNTNTWTAMVGATSSSNGSVGYVNAVPPKDGYNTKYLRADGTWQVPPDHTYTVNNATLTIQKNGSNVATFTSNASSNVTCNITVPTKTSELTNNSGFLTSHQSLSGYVPKSGGAVITGGKLGRTVNNGEFLLCGGTDWSDGSFISLHGQNFNDGANETGIGAGSQRMRLYPSGTWTWTGTAVQIASDQRLKQQITEIDDKLLDAWEDVEPVQFKYNDAVDQKGDNARLHTGYVVQQINEACQKHDVDISEYGLYCHEEYPERTEEVTIENEDGTTTKETKVIEEASEHYSLRYTETLVVECAYLRRENNKLKQQMLQYAESLSKLEERLKALEQTSN